MDDIRKAHIQYRGLELDVTGRYYKGCAARMYLRNGDPGYPEEPPEFEVHEILLNGENITDFFDDMYIEYRYNRKDEYTSCYEEIEDLCIDYILDSENYPSEE